MQAAGDRFQCRYRAGVHRDRAGPAHEGIRLPVRLVCDTARPAAEADTGVHLPGRSNDLDNTLAQLGKALAGAPIVWESLKVGTIAAEYAEEQRRVENEREREAARRNASVWKAHVGRAGTTRRDLGSLAKRLDEAIAAAGFRAAEGAGADGADGALARDLARFARLTVAAAVKQAPSQSRLGTSRLGGLPDLPAGTDWPAIDGEPLSFILQIDLGAVPRRTRGMLPASGLLSLFLGRNESTTRIEHRLLLSRRVGLRPCRPPGDAAFRDANTGVLEPFDLQLQPGLSLPDYESAELAALASRHPILEMKSGRYLEMRAGLEGPELIASLLGYPAGLQAVASASDRTRPRVCRSGTPASSTS